MAAMLWKPAIGTAAANSHFIRIANIHHRHKSNPDRTNTTRPQHPLAAMGKAINSHQKSERPANTA